ncbi:hypothetical protein [Microbacterium sp.]|uniref:hypothetical protein n=1 Tax=Microbacterium sp. TaxID=51671 RepID=UPI002732EFC9|nr:hypothetical protein [Microbacterium sp.]MDP3950401.1 hypothetical protein [Microbacterium sp.]
MTRLMVRVSGAAALVAVLAAGAAPAWAAPSTETIQGEYLRIVSTADWDAAKSLGTAGAVRWDLDVSADAPDPGSVAIELSAKGDVPLVMSASTCSEEWKEIECPGDTEALLVEWAVVRDGTRTPLVVLASTEVAHLRLTIVLGPEADESAGATEVRVHAEGAGDAVSVTPDAPLAATGQVPLAPWITGSAAILMVTGLLMIGRRHTHDEVKQP